MIRPPFRSRSGFTLVELLVAATVALTVTAALLAAVNPAQHLFLAQPEMSDLQQRLRVSVDSLRKDLVMAGAGPYAGPRLGPLSSALAAVMPYRAFGDAPDQASSAFFRSDALSVLYVPSTPSQTVLGSPLPAGALNPQLQPAPNCPVTTSAAVCGFERGHRVLIYDAAGGWDVFSVDQAAGGALVLQHRGPQPGAAYPAGAAVTEVRLGTFYLKSDDAAGTSQLMRHDGWATALPVVDDVVGLEFRYFGAPDPPRLMPDQAEVAAGPSTTYGPAPPPVGADGAAWPAGENCVFRVVDGVHEPRLATLAPDGADLVELPAALLTDGPWCPSVAAANRFDADLLRVRRVRVMLRLQASSAAFRGPAGALFTRGGTARVGDRYVPDLATQLDIVPRNLSLGR